MNQTQTKTGAGKVLGRVLRYMLRSYGPLFLLVLLCIGWLSSRSRSATATDSVFSSNR